MAMKVDASKVDAQVHLAKILLDSGEIEIALKKLRAIELDHPEDPMAKMAMGQAYLENAAYSFAESCFQKVIGIFPKYDLAKLYLGITKLYTGDTETAEKIILTFNEKYKNIREGIAALGLLNFQTSRFKAAADFLSVATNDGIAPMSWKGAYAESLARIGQINPAIDFYKRMVNQFKTRPYIFRLAELYELQGKTGKAIKQYREIKETEGKYILSLLGLSRCYLLEEKFAKAEKSSKKVLTINKNNPEATLILINCLLFQEKQQEALDILESINYTNLSDVFKKTLRVLHALVLDKQEKYDEAMATFKDESKLEKIEFPENKSLSEQDHKIIQRFHSTIDDTRKTPIFVIGTQSTDINNFVHWLNTQEIKILTDRLVTAGRQDVLYSYQKIEDLIAYDDAMVAKERDEYFNQANALLGNNDSNQLFVDCLYTNAYQMATIKKVFPDAKVILLNRETADIWLNQQAFGKEPIESTGWNEEKNQIISISLDLTIIDIDKWLDNDKQVLKILSSIFEKDLTSDNKPTAEYWRRTFFPKGHWKNYKKFLNI
jgi:tetratricopeptide (TPR) repeat protein